MTIRQDGAQRLRATGLRRSVALALAVLLAGAACGSPSAEADRTGLIDAEVTDGQGSDALATESTPDEKTAQSIENEEPAASGTAPGSPERIADLIKPLPAAPTGLPSAAPSGPRPVGLTIGALDVNSAGIINVGVEVNGDMEIPPADKVGWYQFGAKPGDERGSSVLAAHIAFDGEDGVFVELDDIELGTTIQVSYDDDSVVEFVATSKEQYDKNELPKESIFDRSGNPQLVLITCGGDFNESVRSYDDNVVVYASEVGTI